MPLVLRAYRGGGNYIHPQNVNTVESLACYGKMSLLYPTTFSHGYKKPSEADGHLVVVALRKEQTQIAEHRAGQGSTNEERLIEPDKSEVTKY